MTRNDDFVTEVMNLPLLGLAWSHQCLYIETPMSSRGT
jgi:hypothetical protein